MEINTKKIVEEWKANLKKEVEELGARPRLAIITAPGFNEASHIYVRNKCKVAEEIGIDVEVIEMDWQGKTASMIYNDLFWKVAEIDRTFNGIIIQSPYPNISNKVIGEILNPIANKDVDGFSSKQKLLLMENDENALVPCTALGVMHLLDNLYEDLTGKTISICSRSELIGAPLLQLALQRNMTPKVIHSKSKYEPLDSEIIVTGCGQRKIFGVYDIEYDVETIIDCSMTKKEGVQGVGDWDKEEILDCSFIDVNIASGYGHTGLLTTAGLMANVIKAFKIQKSVDKLNK